MMMTKELYKKMARIAALKKQLARLSEDFAQVQAGLVIPNLEQKKAEFIALHDELRGLEGKQPRARAE